MREIKFRVWQKFNNRMNSVSGLSYNPLKVCVGTIMGKNGIPLQCFPIEDVELMQFTGLKDKNGKEIYEGDIIEIDGIGVAEVIMSEGQWVTYREDHMEVGGSLYGWLVPLQVIGNIYENPELLHVSGL